MFGATGDIGRSIAKAALAHHDLVTTVGQSREDTLISTHSPFRAFPDSSLPLLCDIRVRSTVEEVIQRSITHWGRIDIIANHTGYGVIGACEDQDEYDIRNQFETNFFGTINILGASLPYFRTRQPYHQPSSTSIKHEPDSERSSTKSPEGSEHQVLPTGGRYLIFSSTCGALGVPGLGPYSATKHAVEGLIESMLYETHAFNIKATLVEPGHLQADDHEDGPSNKNRNTAPGSQHVKGNDQNHPLLSSTTNFQSKPLHPNSPYNTSTSPAAHPRRVLAWLSQTSSPSSNNQNQPLTSAARCAEVIWQLGHCSYPPLRLHLGAFAVESVRDRLRCIIEEIEEWRWLGFGEGEEEGEGENEEREGSREVKMEEVDDGDGGDGNEDEDGAGDKDEDDEDMQLDDTSSR